MKKYNIKTNNLQWYLEQPIDTKVALMSNFMSELMLLFVNQILEDEVKEKAGEYYSRSNRYSRWGSNPGSVRLGEEKVKIQVPRLYDKSVEQTMSPEKYKQLRELPYPTKELLDKVVVGVSQQDYARVSKEMVESFGLSASSVSRRFVQESQKMLEEYEKRNLSEYDFVALVLDGKYLSKDQIVIALGITMNGDKIPLGFIQTTTENAKAIKGLLKDLLKRGFRYDQGILVISDGSKGILKATDDVFGEFKLTQRCQWHKRENVVSYLREEDQTHYRKKLQRAYSDPDYKAAKEKLLEIGKELKIKNCSAANSLMEGLEETLTLNRLGLVEELGKSLTTTNMIENLNSQIVKYVGRVKYWKHSEMKSRWVTTALMEIEQRMKKVHNYKKLFLLRRALQFELKIKSKKAA